MPPETPGRARPAPARTAAPRARGAASAPAARRRLPAERRGQQIADASLRIIAACGLRAFTAKAIAGELGVTDAAVFRHLPTKHAIVQAAIDRAEAVLFPDLPHAADPVERLAQFFRRRVETISGYPGIAQLMFSEDLARAGGEQGAARVADMKRRSVAFVRSCLEEAGAAGRLAPGVTPRVAALIVLGALMAVTQSPRPPRDLGRAPSTRVPGRGRPAVRLADEIWPTIERLFTIE